MYLLYSMYLSVCLSVAIIIIIIIIISSAFGVVSIIYFMLKHTEAVYLKIRFYNPLIDIAHALKNINRNIS